MRHADISMVYQGADITKSIAGDLLSFEYDENASGDADSLSIELQNKSLKWMNAWMPQSGNTVRARLTTYDWNAPGEKRVLDCGTMLVDEPQFSGPPNKIALKALSTPADQGWNDTANSRTFKKISLSQLGSYFSGKYGLKFVYDSSSDPVLSALKQDKETDAEFLQSTVEKYNLRVKVYSNKLILYDMVTYEARKPVATYTLGKSNISDYSLSAPTVGANYAAATESYTLKGKNYTQTFRAKAGGKVLLLNESADDAAQAMLVCKSKLREKNEQNQSGSLTLSLDLRLSAACTITLAGFGKFNGKWFVDSCNHTYGSSAGQTQINIHKCLEGGY
jgi:uncharacterized protein